MCRRADSACRLKDAVVLVGYTAAGLNDAKPTPVDPVMPGVEVLAEATEALVAGSAIRVPPAWLKYVIAALLVALTASSSSVASRTTTLTRSSSRPTSCCSARLSSAHVLRLFLRCFAAFGFVSLVFGLCRIYAKIQRGRAVGNGDYLPDFDPKKTAGSPSRACISCRMPVSTRGPSCGAAVSIAAGCDASCTLAPTPSCWRASSRRRPGCTMP